MSPHHPRAQMVQEKPRNDEAPDPSGTDAGPATAVPDVSDADVPEEGGTEGPREGEPGEWLVVVSNRLPVVFDHTDEEGWQIGPASGGLVTALEPVLQRRGGVWVGWPGVPEEEVPEAERVLARGAEARGYTMKPVFLTAQETENFYYGFSNEIVWPLFHGFHSRCNFDLRYWESYRRVNRKFARAILESCRQGDFIWVHDYHLMGVADELSRAGSGEASRRVGFFLHIPFPHPEVLRILPWHQEVLNSLLRFDLIGFQTERDRENFLHCVEALTVQGRKGWRRGFSGLRRGKVRSGVFPVSIDWASFARPDDEEVVRRRAREFREEDPVEQIVLGVDRLDYTKGIPHKLRGYRRALERYADLRGSVKLVQILVPSRENIQEYQDLKVEVERLVGEINGEFTEPGWVPIHYLYRSLERTELLAYYRAAQIGLITPLRDGMNLVAKEFCVANPDGNAVLVLSRFAGVAEAFQADALIVNPYDVDEIANQLYRAFRMPLEERKRRMEAMQASVRERDTHWWVEEFLRSTRRERRPRMRPVPSALERPGVDRRGTARRAYRRPTVTAE